MAKMIDLSDTLISDLHKDARGYRPRYLPTHMEEGEFQALWDGLTEELDENMELERANMLDAQREYETRISRLEAAYGIARPTAMRWDMEAETDGDREPCDVGYWLFNQGMAYDLERAYHAEFKAAGIEAYTSAF